MSNKSLKSLKSINLQPIKEDEGEMFASSRITDSNDILLKNNQVELDVERYKIKKTLGPEYQKISQHLRNALDKLCEDRS